MNSGRERRLGVKKEVLKMGQLEIFFSFLFLSLSILDSLLTPFVFNPHFQHEMKNVTQGYSPTIRTLNDSLRKDISRLNPLAC